MKAKPLCGTDGQRLGFDYLTPTQLRLQLRIVRALKDSQWRTRYIKRVSDRLAGLAES